jgi:hypothetical protein
LGLDGSWARSISQRRFDASPRASPGTDPATRMSTYRHGAASDTAVALIRRSGHPCPAMAEEEDGDWQLCKWYRESGERAQAHAICMSERGVSTLVESEFGRWGWLRHTYMHYITGLRTWYGIECGIRLSSRHHTDPDPAALVLWSCPGTDGAGAKWMGEG